LRTPLNPAALMSWMSSMIACSDGGVMSVSGQYPWSSTRRNE
jgi:hypothetical protein